MNNELSESGLPMDESIIKSIEFKVILNYNQKLLRMPFYKREELKKKEERKQKNINHYHQHKKKEDTIKIEKKDVYKIAN